MAYEFRYPMRVEFAETDMAGIVHFTQFFRYMEEAEHAFFRSLGLSVHTQVGDRTISWPRGHVACSFKVPLRFEDEFVVHLLIKEKRRAAITYACRFLRQGVELVAEGTVTAVCVEVDRETGRLAAVAIPEMFDRLLEVAPADTLAACLAPVRQ